jgi:single-stranded-DNA-specific exonuclease
VGEARGPKGVDLVGALGIHKQFFLGYGGHKQAAGFSIERSRIEEFKKTILAYFDQVIDPALLRSEILIDGSLDSADLTEANLRSLLRLEPFGEENRKPVFLLENIDRGMIKEISGALRLGEITLSGGLISREKIPELHDKLSLVVRPFADGSIRFVEVMDLKKGK